MMLGLFKKLNAKGEWRKVSQLKVGMEIAVPKDGLIDSHQMGVLEARSISPSPLRGEGWGEGDVEWDEIVSIEHVGEERVYDIEVEGTHNFVGNNIFAHNTYANAALFMGGLVGIGTTSPSSALQVVGDIQLGSKGAGAAANLIFNTGSTTNQSIIKILATTTLTSNLVLTLPTTTPSAGQFIATDANGNLYWSNAGSCTTTGYSVQYNNAGSLGCISKLLTDGTLVGYNATSSAISFNIQGTAGSANDIFNVASSSAASFLVVKSSGNVGIGTSTPLQKLEVVGAVQLHGSTGSNAGFIVDTSGNVQIGTTTSSAALTVQGVPSATADAARFVWSSAHTSLSLDSGVTLQNVNTTANNYASLFFATKDSNGSNVFPISVQGVFTSHTAGSVAADLVFSTFENGLTPTEVLRIASTGNIGINSSTPGALLSVQGSSGATTDLFNVASSTNTSLFIVKSSGNVGIGTITPASLLDVRGTVFASVYSAPASASTTLQASGATSGNGNNGSIYFKDSSGVVRGRFDTASLQSGNVGNGADGALTVNANSTTTLSAFAGLTGTASAGATSVAVDATSTFAVGNTVLIIQSRDSSASNVGVNEYKTITSVGTNSLTFDSALSNTYHDAGSGTSQATAAQVVKVFQYTNVTVSGVLTASAWDGGKGGILTFRANGTVTVNSGGIISMTGLGYAGGAGVPANTPSMGTQGEGVSGTGTASSSANTVGGGGGGNGSNSNGGGGGGGSNGAGSNGGGATVGTGGNSSAIYGAFPSSYIMGGGGGGGSNTNSGVASGAGANGGGLVLINSSSMSLTGTGAIQANGNNGGSGSVLTGGGGGGGGEINVRTVNAITGTGTLTVTNGTGGTGNQGAGGNGAAGYSNTGTLTGAIYGTLYAGKVDTVNTDVAELYPSSESLSPGEVVIGDLAGMTLIKPSNAAYSNNLLGVISTNPGVIMGGSQADFAKTASSTFPVALTGRVPVRVTNENGQIQPGDYLTSSAQFNGYAMKATHSGQVLGQALSAFSSATPNDSGQVTVFVSPGYQIINNSFVLGASDGQLATATSTQSVASVASSSALSFLINQVGNADILHLQSAGVDRFIVQNDGSLQILADTASSTCSSISSSATSSPLFSKEGVGGSSCNLLTVKNGPAMVFAISGVGHVTVSKDTAGTATILAGQNQTAITFAAAYDVVPKVVITMNGLPGFFYGITQKSLAGFTITTSQPVAADTTFDWVALAQPLDTASNSSLNSAALPIVTANGATIPTLNVVLAPSNSSTSVSILPAGGSSPSPQGGGGEVGGTASTSLSQSGSQVAGASTTTQVSTASTSTPPAFSASSTPVAGGSSASSTPVSSPPPQASPSQGSASSSAPAPASVSPSGQTSAAQTAPAPSSPDAGTGSPTQAQSAVSSSSAAATPAAP